MGVLRCEWLGQGFVDIADEVAKVAAFVQQGDHGIAGGELGGFVVSVEGGVPLRPKVFEVGLGLDHFFVEGVFGGEKVATELGLFIAHLLVGAHLGKLHVKLEDLFEELWRNDLFLLLAGGAGGVGCGL